MSVHHDTAVVQSRDGWLAPSTRIELVGYAYRSNVLMAIWRDDEGYIHDTPAAGLRIEPWMERKPGDPIVMAGRPA